MQSYSLARTATFACAAVVWASWWLTVDRGFADHVPVLLWAAALFLFGAALFRPWQRSKPDVLTAVVIFMIGGAMLPRAIGLDLSPYEVTLDEAIHPTLGADILRDAPWKIFEGVSDHFATPYLDLALQGLLPGVQGARMMSAILSLLSLVTTYTLASRLYDRKTGAFATLVLACAYWHIVYARTAYPFMQVILIPTLALWPLVRGLQEDNDFLLFVGGIFLGLSGLLYTSGRIVVPVFAAWWMVGALAGWWRWRSALPVALGLVVLLSPYVHRNTTGIFFARFIGTTTNELTPFGILQAHGWRSEELRISLATQFAIAKSIYLYASGWLAPHSAAPAPMLDALSLRLALAGLLLCVLRLLRPASVLMLLWVSATFIGGQVLTDVPQSAYRAAPLLPAMAIAAGIALAWVAGAFAWLLAFVRTPRGEGLLFSSILGLVVLAYAGPANWIAVDDFLYQRIVDPQAAMARLVAAGDPRLTYFIVNTEPIVADPRFKLVAGSKNANDVGSLAELLGANLAASAPSTRNGAIIVLGPRLRTGESAIRRCYPGATPLGWSQWKGLQPAQAFWLQPQTIEQGRDCELRSSEERGLRATYYKGDNFDGEVVRTRIEDWPLRWSGDTTLSDFGSIEWRGFLNVPVPGTYLMSLWSSSEGSTVEIGEKVTLQAGQTRNVPLRSRIFRVTMRYRVRPWTSFGLVWQPPGGSPEAIPPELLSPYPRNRSDLRWIE